MRGAGSARLFIAVELPAAVRERLAGWARSALAATSVPASGAGPGSADGSARRRPAARLLAPESMHLTICFLGNRPAAEIDGLGGAGEACAAPLAQMSLGAPLGLPVRRPRVLAVEVRDDSGRLAAMRRALLSLLTTTCADADALAADSGRRFRPHVTVARLRPPAAPSERHLAPTPALSFVPSALVLYRSWLSAEGATYEALTRAPLAAAAGEFRP